MGTVFDSTIVRQRLQRLRRDGDFEDERRYGRCDCTSYSYFVLAMVLSSVGTVVTVLALGSSDVYVLSSLGHMWLVGPIFICSGMMVAVKSLLYLRRKSVIQMLLRQRAIIQDLAQAENSYSVQVPASAHVDPPAYDALIPSEMPRSSLTDPTEPPPPTYDEAMYLIDDEKRVSIMGKDSPMQDSSRGHVGIEHRKP